MSEQRERLLDLVDRVMSAMVEESCPRNRPPEDWDWQGIHDGFKEHIKKPLGKEIEEQGDLERLARAIYERAEQAIMQKQKEVGVENLLRLFRHFYLEEIDREWVDHLTNMEHLRDGIGLRGYGQIDPKNAYKKEGYDLFLNMMANVSSNVLVKVFEVRVERPDDIAAMEAEAEARHQHELEAAVARHPGAEDEAPVGSARAGAAARRRKARRRGLRPLRERQRSEGTTSARAAPARSSRSATAQRWKTKKTKAERVSRRLGQARRRSLTALQALLQ